jgi:D-alanyl-D-alanine carboxypeptidase
MLPELLTTLALAQPVPPGASQPAQPANGAPAAPVTPAAPAAPAPSAGVDLQAIIAPIAQRAGVPGMWVGVVGLDGSTRVAAVGVRQAGDSTPAQPGDKLHLGSCTKSMTATLCAILVAEGVLKWETTLAEALPALKDRLHEGYRGATLAQLCSNRAGVPGNINVGGVLGVGGLWGKLWRHTGTPTEARALLAEGLLTRAPAYPPGTKEEYSNGNFALAGHVAEVATGVAFEELIQRKLFAPLGITTAGFGAPGSAGSIDQPRGHTMLGKPVPPGPDADNPPGIAPAGRVHMSMEDWGKYLALHLRGGLGQASTLAGVTLDADAFEELHTPPDGLSDYAFGWVASEEAWAGPPGVRRVIWHNGSNTMWYAEATLALEKGFAVMVVVNRGSDPAEAGVREAMRKVIAAVNR